MDKDAPTHLSFTGSELMRREKIVAFPENVFVKIPF